MTTPPQQTSGGISGDQPRTAAEPAGRRGVAVTGWRSWLELIVMWRGEWAAARRQAAVAVREAAVSADEEAFAGRQQAFARREREFAEREAAAADREKAVAGREAAATAKTAAVEAEAAANADGFFVIDCPTDGGHDPRAIFLTWVPAIPYVAIAASVLLYAAPIGLLKGGLGGIGNQIDWARSNPLAGGLAAAAIIWLLLAGLAMGFRLTASDQANARNYADLCQRLRGLSARLQNIPINSPDGGTGTEWAKARAEVRAYIGVVKTELSKPGLRWMLGTGYVNLWMLIHRAEEALIEIDDEESVLSGALNDAMRIAGSAMDPDSRNQLTTELVQAVDAIKPAWVAAFGTTATLKQPTASAGTPAADAPAKAPQASTGTQGAEPPAKTSQTSAGSDTFHVLQSQLVVKSLGPGITNSQARAALRHVRLTIDDFRDGLWDALVRSRNHLLAALTVTGVITYLLLVLVLAAQLAARGTAGVDYLGDPIVAASAFYLIGAGVGLFNLLNAESSSSSDLDDYGLTMARMLLTPVLSGLAAVLGVFIVATLPGTLNSDVVIPPASATATTTTAAAPPVAPSPAASAAPSPSSAPAAGVPAAGVPAAGPPAAPTATTTPAASTQRRTPPLTDVFNLRNNLFGLVLATVFGLTPGLLITAIGRVPNEYKSALASTESTTRTKTTTPT